jgi:hypothetical protein
MRTYGPQSKRGNQSPLNNRHPFPAPPFSTQRDASTLPVQPITPPRLQPTPLLSLSSPAHSARQSRRPGPPTLLSSSQLLLRRCGGCCRRVKPVLFRARLVCGAWLAVPESQGSPARISARRWRRRVSPLGVSSVTCCGVDCLIRAASTHSAQHGRSAWCKVTTDSGQLGRMS